MLIKLGHGPGPDDAFMYWALATGAIDTRRFEFEQVRADVTTLNSWALEGRLEVTAVSLHAYPAIQDRYALLPHGAAMGSGYGPVVVALEPMTVEELRDVEIAIPGKSTTAYLVLKMLMGGEFACREVPSDEVLGEVAAGRAGAGLVIREGELTYESRGLHKVVDLGEWWLLETGLPLPLRVNVARRDLGADTLRELSEVLKESIEAALANRREALEYAIEVGRELEPGLADRLVELYVTELACDYGEEGLQAVRELFERAVAAGAYDRPVSVEFVA